MYFSILGDSISTYHGYNPLDFSIFYDEPCCIRNGLGDVNDTWWMQVIQHYHGSLSINNSYSGSRVSGKSFPAANQMERLCYFKKSNSSPNPDFLLVYIGFNDFGYGAKLKNTKLHFRKNIEYFDDAYHVLLKNLKSLLPNTCIICGTLLKTYIRDKTEWVFPENFNGHTVFDNYNEVIRYVCHKNSVFLADLSDLYLRYESLDGTHPTVRGHKEIAKSWILSLESLPCIFK